MSLWAVSVLLCDWHQKMKPCGWSFRSLNSVWARLLLNHLVASKQSTVISTAALESFIDSVLLILKQDKYHWDLLSARTKLPKTMKQLCTDMNENQPTVRESGSKDKRSDSKFIFPSPAGSVSVFYFNLGSLCLDSDLLISACTFVPVTDAIFLIK